MHLVLEGWCHEFGPSYTIELGPKRVFVSSDSDFLQTALRERPQRYRRFAPIESVFAEMGANGVFSVEGEAWHPQRKLIMQALAATNFRSFFPALQTITQRLLRRWQAAAARGETVEMTQDLVRYNVDVTTTMAFGEDPNTLEQSGNVIQEHLAQIFPMIMARINAPFPLWRYLKLPQDYRFDRSLQAVNHHVEMLIERTRKHMHDVPSVQPRNLLEAMLTSSAQAGSGITDAIVSANVMTLLLAGEDTTAHTLAWSRYFLCTHAQTQARLQAEARALLARPGSAWPLTI